MTEARAQFAELINRVGYGKERIVLTRHGKPLVALVPAESLSEDQAAGGTVLDLTSQAGSHRTSTGIAAQDSTDLQT